VLRDGGRVVGVRVQRGGRSSELRARIVVGADGRNSTIARRVAATEYHSAEMERGGYWGYFPVTPAVESLGFQAYIEIDGAHARFFFRCDGGLVVAGALAPRAVARTWAGDVEGSLRAGLMASKVTRLLVESGAAPVRRPVGLMKGRSYFRVPVGPGWALVGDAGLHKDPTPGYGITDALRDAKALASAILDGREAALELYWRQRDVDSIALYANAVQMGSLEYHNPLNELVMHHCGRSPAFAPRLQAVFERELSPFDVASPGQVMRWMVGAVLNGQRGFLAPFMSSGKRGSWLAREVSERTALLDAAKRRLERAGPPHSRVSCTQRSAGALTA
jgi:flavin-dependent dehydrogenase